MTLVLSLFPGIGLLDMAFEDEGFCVVRGPDLLWGGDIRRFHPPAGKFDGVIGGPPCQAHSTLGHLSLAGNGVRGGQRHGDMIPEFWRVVCEAAPCWWVMENVPNVPAPCPDACLITLNNRWLGEEQNRLRWFYSNLRLAVETAALECVAYEHAVLAGHGPGAGQRVRGIKGRAWHEMAKLQGLDDQRIATLAAEADYFSVHGFKRVIGNGVPLQMGRAIARAVRRASGMTTGRAGGEGLTPMG